MRILDKYAQVKADIKLKQEEEARKIQEELDAKDPLKQYEKIQRELAESKKKYSKQIQDNIEKSEAEKRIKLEGIEREQNEKEEKALKSLESLFLKLGGNLEEVDEEEKKLNENDIGIEPETLEVAETQQQKNDIEEPIGMVEETVGHEEDVEVVEETKEEKDELELEPIKEDEGDTVSVVAEAITKQEKNKEKEDEDTKSKSYRKRIELLEKKVTKLLLDVSTVGGGAGFIKDLGDVDVTGITNNKILKYNSTSGKWVIADDSGGTGSGSSTFTGLSDTPINFTGSQGKVLAVNNNEDALEFINSSTNSTTFSGLTDTPTNFTGSQGKLLAVNSNEDAVEFVDASTNTTTFSGLTDTPTNFTGSQGRLLSVNSAENAVEFVEDQSFINSIIFG